MIEASSVLTKSTGVGKELCKILYQHNGTVYVAGRSQSKADSAIEEIKQAHPNSDGRLEFLHVDLADLPTIKKSVEDFQKREQRLDVLTNSEFARLRKHAVDYEIVTATLYYCPRQSGNLPNPSSRGIIC